MSLDPVTTDLLDDAFGRVRELVEQQCSDLDESTATFQVDDGANTPVWLLWHLARVQDDHVAALADVPQAWDTWAERFAPHLGDGIEHGDIGYGHDLDQVLSVRPPAELVDAYHADVHALTRRYLRTLDATELARVVDERWDPPVTASARLVSVLGDTLQHLGQVAFVVGVAQRRSS
ncbi:MULTISPECIES: DinB family protein [unclassified Aeromicrobium]|uniref:mycothiol transferase n=1 Tax=unclassified Aeromicrobium TaxID=2633570 RepID=UPI0006F63114|nr:MULTISPECIES: DinB family protein [unclassified Aeromicrobium]KQO41779.1 hypothetical protein ASF05_11745 [Aeromicrobium sp. Leaf245]KQP27111.1 hypothetical protein ASF38_04865 [Aeromicrobium sp. Leaf272]KQP77132.1 hypothetical protein ASF37_11190 [Aeromicrobium sp. Leaf289]KQP81165.1 hypothetical protein ASF35_13850 [Aeromicrobium sp. Leaf291]